MPSKKVDAKKAVETMVIIINQFSNIISINKKNKNRNFTYRWVFNISGTANHMVNPGFWL